MWSPRSLLVCGCVGLDFLSASAMAHTTQRNMNVKAFMPSTTPTPTPTSTPSRLYFFAFLFISAHAYKISGGSLPRGLGRIALATFMAYSELIALSFSHFILAELPRHPGAWCEQFHSILFEYTCRGYYNFLEQWICAHNQIFQLIKNELHCTL